MTQDAAGGTAGDTNRIYAVALDKSGHLAVNVPWVNTTYDTGVGLTSTTISGTPTFKAKLITDTSANVASTNPSITTGRFYSVITDKSGNLAVSVPWTDTNVVYTLATENTSGLMSAEDKRKLDSLYEVDGTGTVKNVTAGIGLATNTSNGQITTTGTIKANLRSDSLSSYNSTIGTGDASRLYSVIADKSGYLSVMVPWTDTNTNTEYDAVTTTANGLMIASDKVKLDSISANASVASVATGVGLDGGTITSTGTIKAKLKNETLLSVDSTAPITVTADRTYAVLADKSGFLSVYVPWSNTEYSNATTSAAGLMSAADKTKLNGIAAGAQPGTVTSITTGVGLTGGPITETGSIKVSLVNETPLSSAAGTDRIYPVVLDKNNKLAVNVPWVNDNTEYSAMTVAELKTGTASTSRTMTAANIKSAFTDGIFTTGTTAGTFKVYNTEIPIAGLGDLAYINKGSGSTKFLKENGTWDTPQDTKYAAGSGLSLSTTDNKFSITTGGVTNAMLAGNITNAKLVNSSITIAGNQVSLGSSLDAATLTSSLGLSSALRFVGITTTSMLDNYSSDVTVDGAVITPKAGDVIIDSDSNYEYVFTGTHWERLGSDSSYKVVQIAVNDPSASGTSTTFIKTIQQNAQGVITATKASLPEASTSTAGIIQITKANTNIALNLLDTYTDSISDSTKFLRKHATASEYGYQEISALWTYIKDKIGIATTGDTYLRKDGTWATPTNTTYTNASQSSAGLMSAADKKKLDGIAAGAQVGTVTKVSSGVGLLGGDITSTGTLKVDLVTETPYQNDSLTPFETADRLYSVGVDKSGHLAVMVPWADTQITYSPVTQSMNGLMLATDKVKLDGIAAGAQPGTVTSIATSNGITGGTITETGTLGLNLKSTTPLTIDSANSGNTANRAYAVALDKSGYLAVNVPWNNTTYTFDGTYNASSNKAATVSSITTRIATAIEALDGDITGTPGASSTITAFEETNGVVTATFAPISITKSQISDFPTSLTPSSHTHGNITNAGTLSTANRIVVTDGNKKITVGSIDPANLVTTDDARLSDARTPVSHTHGNITNDGKITATGVAIANNDALVIVDNSDSNSIIKTSIVFDGSTSSKALTQKGTWETFNNYSHPTTTGNKHIPAGGSSGQILRWSADGTAVWGADNDTKYTAGSGLSLSSGNEFSITTGGVTNAMLAGSIANEKLSNSKVTIAGNDVSLGGSLSAATLKTSLGLNSALHYIGKTDTEITDGSTTGTVSINSTNITATSGDIVIDSNNNYEYIWNGSAWEAFGPEGSYKIRQEPVTDPNAGSSGQINFINSISQNENGEITATKQPVRSASTSQTGVTQYTAANLNTWLWQLTTGDSDPVDNDYFISQYVNGGTTTKTFHRRPVSKLYNYIKTKLAITNAGATLSWGSAVKVATIGGTDINVSLPSNPNTDRYVNSAAFADATSANANAPVKMTLTRAGSDTQTVTANIPKVSSSSAGVAPKGAAVSSQTTSTKFLREDGTWAAPSYIADTHYTTHLRTASSATSTTQVTVETTSPYLNLLDNSDVRDSVRFVGSGTTTVKASADGKTITISSADSKTGTVTKVSTGAGLTGGDITTTGTIKANLSSETSLGTLGTTAKLYAVGVDENGKLAVNVPWTDNNTTSFTITANATDGLWDLTGTSGTNAVTYALAPYNAKSTSSRFYTGTTNPTLTTRLNYDGYLYATKLYSNGAEVLTSHQDLSNYKTKQTAITDSTGSADGSNTATTFIYSISQDANGVVSVKTRNLPTYNNYVLPTATTSIKGGVKVGTGLTMGGTNNEVLNHSNSVTAKTTAAQSAKTLTWGDTFTIYEEKYDAQGHITGVLNYNMTMPGNPNTDAKVTQTNITATTSAEYRVLLSGQANDTTATEGANKNTNLRFNTGTKVLSVGGSISATGDLDLTGNANLNGETYADSVTAGSLLVTGAAAFTNSPTAPTPAATSNDNTVATTAFVKTSISGLSGAMHFRGTTTTALTDGTTTAAVTIGGSSYTPAAGDVVLYGSKEFVWTGSLWELLGDEGSYKVKQTAITNSTGTADGSNTATTFIYSFSQDANGVVSVKTRKLPTYNNYTHPAYTAHNAAAVKIGNDATGHVVIGEAITYTDVGAASSGHTHGNITNAGALNTASRIVVTDTDKKITVGTIDPANLVTTDDSRLSDARTPTSHSHGNITNDGKIGTTANYAVYTTTGGAVTAGSLAVSEPTASGTATAFISTISQNSKGQISVAKANLPTASTSTAGIIQIGTGATNAAAGNHTHTTSLATSTGTSTITLAHGSKYQLTAGGTSVIFTMPTDNNTDTKVKQSVSTTEHWRKILLHYKDDAASTTAVTDSTDQVYAAQNISVQPSTGTIRATAYNVADHVILQYNTTTSALDFVFI